MYDIKLKITDITARIAAGNGTSRMLVVPSLRKNVPAT